MKNEVLFYEKIDRLKSGLVERSENSEFRHKNDNIERQEFIILTVDELKIAFILIAIGFCLALVVFLFELLINLF